MTPETIDLVASAFEAAIPTPPRGLAQWAEEECFAPEGPYEGLPFRVDRQPFMRLAYEVIDSGVYRRVSVVG